MEICFETLRWMRFAERLALRGWGRTSPNPIVGAVLVKDGVVVGRGWHRRAGEAHAEIEAIRDAGPLRASGADLYVTLEPCSTFGRTPPCTEAIVDAGIRRVFWGSTDPNPKHAGRAFSFFESSGIRVVSGIDRERCDSLNDAFFHWILTGAPFVLLKMATTLDGRIATRSGHSKWITGPVARKRVHRLRQWADAILVGGGTARTDHPSLNARNACGECVKSPRRFVATRSMSETELADFMPGSPVPEVVRAETREEWLSVLRRLGSEQVTALLVEGGGTVAGSLLAAGVVNRVELHVAPRILGDTGRPAVVGFSPGSIGDALSLRNIRVDRLGGDVRIVGEPER